MKKDLITRNNSVIKGGNIAKIAKEQLEKETGKKVISDRNAREMRNLELETKKDEKNKII